MTGAITPIIHIRVRLTATTGLTGLWVVYSLARVPGTDGDVTATTVMAGTVVDAVGMADMGIAAGTDTVAGTVDITAAMAVDITAGMVMVDTVEATQAVATMAVADSTVVVVEASMVAADSTVVAEAASMEVEVTAAATDKRLA